MKQKETVLQILCHVVTNFLMLNFLGISFIYFFSFFLSWMWTRTNVTSEQNLNTNLCLTSTK